MRHEFPFGECATPSGVIPLVLATRNAHKTEEFAQILGSDFAVTDLRSLPDCPAIDETGDTFEENAMLKAVTASQWISHLVVGDDSGLEVDALGGAPGVYSARYAGEDVTDEENVAKLLAALRDVPAESRQARFRCVLAIARNGAGLTTFIGTVEGTITNVPSGTGGFGYDPVFTPAGFRQTFGELGEATKNQTSHRAKATEQLRVWLPKFADATWPTAVERSPARQSPARS